MEHLDCFDGLCASVSGPGENLCITSADCIEDNEHLECAGDACVPVLGAGENLCIDNTDCLEPDEHFECIRDLCTVVSGPGVNRCATSADCIEEEEHLACNKGACIAIPGSGKHECFAHEECTLRKFCGDALLSKGEECEVGVACTDPRKTCDLTMCKCVRGAAGTCGDFVVNTERGEECDQGAGNSDILPDHCRTNCTLPLCGDSVVDSGEQCDDGNVRSKDGCNESCRREETIIAQRPELRELRLRTLMPTPSPLSVFEQNIAATSPTPPNPTPLPFSTAIDARGSKQLAAVLGEATSPEQVAFPSEQKFAFDAYGRPLTYGQFSPYDIQQLSPYQQYFAQGAQGTMPWGMNFPQYPITTGLPLQLPLAQLQPLLRGQPQTTQTGPAAIAIVAAGAAVGFGWMRRKQR